jgi:hypothetical protein
LSLAKEEEEEEEVIVKQIIAKDKKHSIQKQKYIGYKTQFILLALPKSQPQILIFAKS